MKIVPVINYTKAFKMYGQVKVRCLLFCAKAISHSFALRLFVKISNSYVCGLNIEKRFEPRCHVCVLERVWLHVIYVPTSNRTKVPTIVIT